MMDILWQRLRLYLSKPEIIAFSLAAIFGIASAFMVPQMSVNDENAHLLKAYSLSTGKLTGRTCDFPKSILNEAESTIEHSPKTSAATIDYNQTSTTGCGSAAGYSPIMHTPQAIGMTLSKLFNASPDMMVLFGRIANAIFYAGALFFIIRFVKIGKWAYLVVGLFPLMIHTAGSLSADTINNVIVMASIAFIINLFIQDALLSKRQLGLLTLLGIFLALTKPTNLVLLLPLVALPVRLFNKNPKSRRLPFNFHKWLVVCWAVFISAATTLIAYKLLGSMLFREDDVQNPLVTDPLKFFPIAYNTYINPVLGYGDLLIRGVVGEFSSFKYHLPTFIVFAEFIALAIALLYKHSDEQRIRIYNLGSFAFFSAAALLLFVAAITIALFSAWAILPRRLGPDAFYADGVQGRYFTAALVALIPIGVWLRKRFSITTSNTVARSLIIAISLGSLLFYIIETHLVFS